MTEEMETSILKLNTWYYIKSATQPLGSLECGGLNVKQPRVPKNVPLQIMFHPVNAGGL